VEEMDQESDVSGAVNNPVHTRTTNYQAVDKKPPFAQCCIPLLCTFLITRPYATAMPHRGASVIFELVIIRTVDLPHSECSAAFGARKLLLI